MDCDACRSLLSAYQAGDLGADESQEVAVHLETCAACTKELEAFGRLDALVQGLARHVPSTRAQLRVKSATAYPAPPAPRKVEFGSVLDVDELAEYLRVSRETLEDYIDEIPCFELGGRLLFRKRSIEEWIENRERNYGFERTESQISRILVAEDIDEGGTTWKI